jgi:homogentisate 1,2-dioxygenase
MPGRPEKVSYESAPNIDLVRGMHTHWVLSSERNDADEVNLGICHHDADMADLVWDQTFDEIFYCAKGKLKVFFEDKKTGKKGELVANEGEALFLPRDQHYVLTATGVDSVNVFTHKGHDLSMFPDYSKQLSKLKENSSS